MPVKLQKKGKGAGRPSGSGLSKLQWFDLKEKFIARHVAGDYVSFPQFAKDHNLNLRTLEYHATRESWMKEVEKRLGEQHQAISLHSQNVVQAIRKSVSFDEVEVRTRHSNAFKGLIRLALKKLVKIKDDPDQLSVRDMIDILKFAPLEERRALGLPETVQVEVSHKVASAALEQFEKTLQERNKVAAAMAEMTRMIEGEVISKTVENAPDDNE